MTITELDPRGMDRNSGRLIDERTAAPASHAGNQAGGTKLSRPGAETRTWTERIRRVREQLPRRPFDLGPNPRPVTERAARLPPPRSRVPYLAVIVAARV